VKRHFHTTKSNGHGIENPTVDFNMLNQNSTRHRISAGEFPIGIALLSDAFPVCQSENEYWVLV